MDTTSDILELLHFLIAVTLFICGYLLLKNYECVLLWFVFHNKFMLKCSHCSHTIEPKRGLLSSPWKIDMRKLMYRPKQESFLEKGTWVESTEQCSHKVDDSILWFTTRVLKVVVSLFGLCWWLVHLRAHFTGGLSGPIMGCCLLLPWSLCGSFLGSRQLLVLASSSEYPIMRK